MTEHLRTMTKGQLKAMLHKEEAKMQTQAQMKICSICQREFKEFGNNARPINDGRCCDDCNTLLVIPARIRMLHREEEEAK
jgi:hypothetical protein